MRAQREAAGGGRSGRLLERVWRRARPGPPGGPGGPQQRERALDWRELQEHLEPVLRHWWDVAILAALDEQEGRQTGELLAVINARAGSGRQLTPQVLSVRLRALAQEGYVWREDVSRTPVTWVYRLLPPGTALIGDLASFSFLLRTRGSRAGSSPPAMAGMTRAARAGSGRDGR